MSADADIAKAAFASAASEAEQVERRAAARNRRLIGNRSRPTAATVSVDEVIIDEDLDDFDWTSAAFGLEDPEEAL